jgi:hypothetical protein
MPDPTSRSSSVSARNSPERRPGVSEASPPRAERVSLHSALSAPVEIPSMEEMTVRLVPKHRLDRFVDAEADRRVAGNAFWCSMGVTSSLLATLAATGECPTPAEVITASAVMGASVLTWMWNRRLSRRAGRAAERLSHQS